MNDWAYVGIGLLVYIAGVVVGIIVADRKNRPSVWLLTLLFSWPGLIVGALLIPSAPDEFRPTGASANEWTADA